MNNTSNAGDLTQLAEDLEAVFQKHFPDEEKPAMAIAFTLPPDYKECHWVTNTDRASGIRLFASTAQKMQAQTN